MKWHFVKYGPDATTRDPIVGEFFSTDATPNPAQALVREGIQNALDASSEKQVQVRIFCGSLKDSTRINFWLGGAWDHYATPKNGLGNLPSQDDEMPFLVFEDFGTTGLQGDIEQAFDLPDIKNSFYYFFRAEGRSGKSEQDRGRWGVGKHVFPRASRISSFLALTARKDDKTRLLMGRSILKSRWVNGEYYSPDGYLGENEDKDKPTLPIIDEGIISGFCKDFQIKRKNEPGLSIVVPYIESDNTAANVQKAVIEDYFYPILKGDLTVTVETEVGEIEITSETLLDLSSSVDLENFASVVKLADWSINAEKIAFELISANDKRPVWSNNLIPVDVLPDIRNKFEAGEYLAIKANLNVRQKDDIEVQSFFTVYLRQEKNDEGRPLFVREGIIISDVKPKRTRGVLSLVVIEDKPLATLLGDSENPAHTQWQKDSSNFRNKYKFGKSYIEFVTNIVSDIVSSLSAQEEELDSKLILDIFSLPAEEEEAKREIKKKDEKPGSEQNTPDIKVHHNDKKFILEQITGGFSVKSNNAKLSYPAKVEIDVAYDTRKGNPLQKYDISDFRLDQSPIKVRKPPKGMNIIKIRENVIYAEITKDDFEISATGFDQNRDLYVKVRMSEGNYDKTV
jgi:hypothetical protein